MSLYALLLPMAFGSSGLRVSLDYFAYEKKDEA